MLNWTMMLPAVALGCRWRLEPNQSTFDLILECMSTLGTLMREHQNSNFAVLFCVLALMLSLRWAKSGSKGMHPLWSMLSMTTSTILIASCREKNLVATVLHVASALGAEDCTTLITQAEALSTKQGSWRSTQRHFNYPTEDISLDRLPAAAGVRHKLSNTLFEPAAAEFCGGECDVVVAEAFVVRYHESGQRMLEPHIDGHMLSFNVALSTEGFTGGGTRFLRPNRTVRLTSVGDALVHPARVWHEGLPVTEGARYILVGFCELRMRCATRVAKADTSDWLKRLWCHVRDVDLRFGRLHGLFASKVAFVSADVMDIF